MSYAILRTAKLKNAAAIRAAGSHQRRTRATPNAAADGPVVVVVDPGSDPYAAVLERIQRAGVRIRRNAVLAQEVLLSASPEFFRPDEVSQAGQWQESRLQAWAQAAQHWLHSQFGDRLVSAHRHEDEATPHLHALVVPLTADGRLSAREVFCRQTLRAMQTRYAQALAPLQIRRGLERSRATHTQIQHYYRLVNQPLPELPQVASPPVLFSVAAREDWAQQQTRRLHAHLEAWLRKAQASEQAVRKTKAYQETADAWRRDAVRVAALSLQEVLKGAGLRADTALAGRWRGQGLEIQLDPKQPGVWQDLTAREAGCGALALAVRLTGGEPRDVLAWLSAQLGMDAVLAEQLLQARQATAAACATGHPAAPPRRDPQQQPSVVQALVTHWGVAPALVNRLLGTGHLYADSRGRAVFLYGEGAQLGCGIELVTVDATGETHYRGASSYFLNGAPDQGGDWVVCDRVLTALSVSPPPRFRGDRGFPAGVRRGFTVAGATGHPAAAAAVCGPCSAWDPATLERLGQRTTGPGTGVCSGSASPWMVANHSRHCGGPGACGAGYR